MPEAHKHEGEQDQIRVDRYVALLRQTPHGLDLSMKLYDQQIMVFFTTGMVLIGKLAHRVILTFFPAGLAVQLYNQLNLPLIAQQIIGGVYSSDLLETWLAITFFNSVRDVLAISEVVRQDVKSFINEYQSLGGAIEECLKGNNELNEAVIREALGLNEADALQQPIKDLVDAAKALNENKTDPELVETYEQCLEKVIGANNRSKASQVRQNITQNLKEILKLRRGEELSKFKVYTSTPGVIFRVISNMLTFVKCFEKVNDLLESKAKDGVKYSDIKSELEAFDEQDRILLSQKEYSKPV